MSVTTTDERKILVPYDKRECISLKEAADIAGKSESTMRGRCIKDGLGRRVGDETWMVSKIALKEGLAGLSRGGSNKRSGGAVFQTRGAINYRIRRCLTTSTRWWSTPKAFGQHAR